MNTLSPKAEIMLSDLASQPGVTQQHMAGLRDAITRSPALVELFNDTLANSSGSKPELTALGVMSPGDNYGAKYDPSSGTLELNLQSMLSAAMLRENSGNLTFLFAHELEHARNASHQPAGATGYAGRVARGRSPPAITSAPTRCWSRSRARWRNWMLPKASPGTSTAPT